MLFLSVISLFLTHLKSNVALVLNKGHFWCLKDIMWLVTFVYDQERYKSKDFVLFRMLLDWILETSTIEKWFFIELILYRFQKSYQRSSWG